MEERIQVAYEAARQVCYQAIGGSSAIPKEDQLILDKYIASGVIKSTKGKVKLGLDIYYPTLQAKEFEGLSGDIWLRIIRQAMSDYGIKSGIGRNSVNEYLTKPWEYKMSNDSLMVVSRSYVGTKQLEEEEQAWKGIQDAKV